MMIATNQGYREFGDYLRQVFPHYKVQKITLNAGFTCPNRDGLKGWGGCTYCNNQTFSPAFAMKDRSVSEQLRDGIAFFARKYPHMKYLAYFQAYTNTYGEQAEIIRKYEEALNYYDVVGIIIGTRPDCMPDSLLSYLKDLSERVFVLVEYGVESTLDATLRRVNRGHLWSDSMAAIERTAKTGLPIGVHLILGLPGKQRRYTQARGQDIGIARHYTEIASTANYPRYGYGQRICRESLGLSFLLRGGIYRSVS